MDTIASPWNFRPGDQRIKKVCWERSSYGSTFCCFTMGVMAVLNLTIGGITPPMAPSLFVSAKVADLPFEKTLKHIYPMLVPLVVALLMVTFIKPLTLFLPGLLL